MKKFFLNEISIVPAELSQIQSRDEITIDKSPWWVAPMDTIVDVTNLDLFLERNINTILPRKEWIKLQKVPCSDRFWFAITLDEARQVLDGTNEPLIDFIESLIEVNSVARVLIDVANGHMESLYSLGYSLKNKYDSNISLMTGNIANPRTLLYAQGIFDHIKIGIGGGSRCLTTNKTGIHYPLGSLIHECSEFKYLNNLKINLIADGGISGFGDAVKAIYLGADPMMGKMFNSAIEACGETRVGVEPHTNVMPKNEAIAKFEKYKMHWKFSNLYRGMSTKAVQNKENRAKISPEEGFSSYNEVLYGLEEMEQELWHSLKSAMSYCGTLTLEEFKGKGIIPETDFLIL